MANVGEWPRTAGGEVRGKRGRGCVIAGEAATQGNVTRVHLAAICTDTPNSRPLLWLRSRKLQVLVIPKHRPTVD